MGFDDSYLARITYPELTTIRHPQENMGRLASARFLSTIAGSDHATPTKTVMSPEIIVTNSSKIIDHVMKGDYQKHPETDQRSRLALPRQPETRDHTEVVAPDKITRSRGTVSEALSASRAQRRIGVGSQAWNFGFRAFIHWYSLAILIRRNTLFMRPSLIFDDSLTLSWRAHVSRFIRA